MLGDVLGVLGVGLLSALVPLVNIEVYLAARGAVASVQGLWGLALMAALGQMVGKVVWYYIGASSLRWPWVRRKMETPRALERLERWRERTHARPVIAGALVLVSAFSGFPPFAVVAVVAGQLRMSLVLFFALGLAGRWLRFAAVLGGAAWVGGMFR